MDRFLGNETLYRSLLDRLFEDDSLQKLGGALASGDDGAGVAHLLAFRRGEACNVGDNRLGHMLGCPLGRILFGTTADFTDHHDSLGGIIVFERLKRLLQRSADDRVQHPNMR